MHQGGLRRDLDHALERDVAPDDAVTFDHRRGADGHMIADLRPLADHHVVPARKIVSYLDVAVYDRPCSEDGVFADDGACKLLLSDPFPRWKAEGHRLEDACALTVVFLTDSLIRRSLSLPHFA